jgi:hypothetical protein
LRGVALEQVTRALAIWPVAWTQEAVGADLGEAAWKYVLEEARDETFTGSVMRRVS